VKASTSMTGRAGWGSFSRSLCCVSPRSRGGPVCVSLSASLVANVRAKGLYGAPFPPAGDFPKIPSARAPYLMLKSASSGPSSSAALESLPFKKPACCTLAGVTFTRRPVASCNGVTVVSGDRGGVWILTRFFSAVRAERVAVM
jgi:hypothetical protein